MTLQYEFDTMEELKEAMKNLEAYHDCEKCHGKIVTFRIDYLGRQTCGYCGRVVRYPRLRQGAFLKLLEIAETTGGKRK